MHALANILIVIASMVLVISYFLPFEGWSWSAYRMAHGYAIAGGYEEGFAVALSNTVPYGIGVVLPLAMILQRRNKIAMLILLAYGALWLAAVAMYLVGFFQLPDLRYAWFWALCCILATPFIAALILAWRHRSSQPALQVLALVLACAFIVEEAVGIAFCLLEDQELINYGAVTSLAAASVLAVVFMFRYQLYRVDDIPIEASSIE